MRSTLRIVTGLVLVVGLAQFGQAVAFNLLPGVDGTVNPHASPDGDRDENCSICHDTEGYVEGAHGDPETGVYRLPEYPIGDCLHCHDFDELNPFYLFQAYVTDAQKRALCLFCHDGFTAPAPQPPPSEHEPDSTTPCVECHDPHIPMNLDLSDVPRETDQADRAGRLMLDNTPNPFAHSTEISYVLPQSGPVCVEIFDVRGRLVENLYDGIQEQGYHQLSWIPGEKTKGVYFVRVLTEGAIETKRILLLE